MTDSKTVKTSMESGLNLAKDEKIDENLPWF